MKIKPSQSAREILVRGLTREDLFKFEFTGYRLGESVLLSPEQIQNEMTRRAKFSPKWYFNK